MSAPTHDAPGITEVGADGAVVVRDEEAPRHSDQTPAEWVKENLFSSVFNSIVTLVFGAIALILGFFAVRFVFTTAQWIPVRTNLELFMIGQFPRGERTRMVVELLMASGAVGLVAGWLRQRARREAELTGEEPTPTSVRRLVGSYWAVGAFVVFCMVVGVRSAGPWLLLGGCVVAGAAGFAATLPVDRSVPRVLLHLAPLAPLVIAGGTLSSVQDLNNSVAYTLAIGIAVLLVIVQFVHRPEVTLSAGLLLGTASFLVISGTHGLSWAFLTVSLLPAIDMSVGALHDRLPVAAGWLGVAVAVVGLVVLFVLTNGELVLEAPEFDGVLSLVVVPVSALTSFLGGLGFVAIGAFAVVASAVVALRAGDIVPAVRLGLVGLIGIGTWWIGRIIDVQGLQWDSWGFHMNLVVAAAAIVIAFPIGVLLALGRRSSLPVVRLLSTVYIEIIRGVPLITLLFIAQIFLNFFFSTRTNLPLVTRATIVITLFSAAYIAEIVRGGLQSVDRGQTEAGQAMGMSPGAITRLLVLPQALKNVIPALVGQFISLFKDTSLLSFITVLEFLGVRDIIHAQAEFRALGIAETLVFVAFGFWAFSYTMSRESQRLERRLDVGNR